MTNTYNFDEIIDRRATDSFKWATGTIFGKEDAIPLWVADMDFRAPQPVIDAIVERARQGIFGYPLRSSAFYQSLDDVKDSEIVQLANYFSAQIPTKTAALISLLAALTTTSYFINRLATRLLPGKKTAAWWACWW